MKKRNWWIILIIVIVLVLALKLFSYEDDWICVNGEWIEHGVPGSAKPDGYCVDGVIDNFKECVAAGNPVMESYPRQCKNSNQTFTEIIEHFCLESETADFCTTIYEPVCGLVQVECITAPCPPVAQTFSNSCFACQNERVLYWIEGECK